MSYYQGEHGSTPLHAAVMQGHAPVIEVLILARCNVDLLDIGGRTAQQMAELKGYTGIATLIQTRSTKEL